MWGAGDMMQWVKPLPDIGMRYQHHSWVHHFIYSFLVMQLGNEGRRPKNSSPSTSCRRLDWISPRLTSTCPLQLCLCVYVCMSPPITRPFNQIIVNKSLSERLYDRSSWCLFLFLLICETEQFQCSLTGSLFDMSVSVLRLYIDLCKYIIY